MTREEKEIIFQAAYIRRKDAVYWWKKYNEFPENDIFFDSWRSKESRYLVIKEIIDKLDLDKEFMKYILKKKKLEGENINANVGNF